MIIILFYFTLYLYLFAFILNDLFKIFNLDYIHYISMKEMLFIKYEIILVLWKLLKKEVMIKINWKFVFI